MSVVLQSGDCYQCSTKERRESYQGSVQTSSRVEDGELADEEEGEVSKAREGEGTVAGRKGAPAVVEDVMVWIRAGEVGD